MEFLDELPKTSLLDELKEKRAEAESMIYDANFGINAVRDDLREHERSLQVWVDRMSELDRVISVLEPAQEDSTDAAIKNDEHWTQEEVNQISTDGAVFAIGGDGALVATSNGNWKSLFLNAPEMQRVKPSVDEDNDF